uniref:G_PROTEIN_RECEP_F1_2 domain-containing protein n=1 Tax=Heterorhabditis bacteriophora TaxID=37862 RepID=A0A1I7WBF3_HETBA
MNKLYIASGCLYHILIEFLRSNFNAKKAINIYNYNHVNSNYCDRFIWHGLRFQPYIFAICKVTLFLIMTRFSAMMVVVLKRWKLFAVKMMKHNTVNRIVNTWLSLNILLSDLYFLSLYIIIISDMNLFRIFPLYKYYNTTSTGLLCFFILCEESTVKIGNIGYLWLIFLFKESSVQSFLSFYLILYCGKVKIITTTVFKSRFFLYQYRVVFTNLYNIYFCPKSQLKHYFIDVLSRIF